MADQTGVKKEKMKKLVEGSRKSADSIGISLAVVLSWAIGANGTEIPPEVIASFSGLIGAVAARFRDKE